MVKSILFVQVLIVFLFNSVSAQNFTHEQDKDMTTLLNDDNQTDYDLNYTSLLDEQLVPTYETSFIFKSQDILEITQLACGRQDNGLDILNPSTLVDTAATAFNYESFLEDQRSVAFDRSTKMALNYIYNKTLSSDEAKFKVSNVLKKYNCNSSIPDQIEYKEWIGKNISFGTEMDAAYHSLAMNENLSQPSEIEDRWRSLGFTSECSQTRELLDGICTGELTPRIIFDELKTQNINDQNKDSFGIKDFIEWTIDFAYKVYRDIKADNERKDAAVLIVQNNDLARENETLRNMNIELQKNFENAYSEVLERVAQESITNISPETEKSLDQLRRHTFNEQQKNLNTIRENDEKIKENTVQILSVVPYQYEPPKQNVSEDSQTEIANEKNEEVPITEDKEIFYPSVHEETALAFFVENDWKELQKELVDRSNACFKLPADMMGPSTLLPSNTLKVPGETCNFEMALQELNEMVPVLYEAQAQSNYDNRLDQRIQNTVMNMPVCDFFNPCSQEFMDQYYKSQGFNGGEAEFCALTNDNCDNDMLYFQAQDDF